MGAARRKHAHTRPPPPPPPLTTTPPRPTPSSPHPPHAQLFPLVATQTCVEDLTQPVNVSCQLNSTDLTGSAFEDVLRRVSPGAALLYKCVPVRVGAAWVGVGAARVGRGCDRPPAAGARLTIRAFRKPEVAEETGSVLLLSGIGMKTWEDDVWELDVRTCTFAGKPEFGLPAHAPRSAASRRVAAPPAVPAATVTWLRTVNQGEWQLEEDRRLNARGAKAAAASGAPYPSGFPPPRSDFSLVGLEATVTTRFAGAGRVGRVAAGSHVGRCSTVVKAEIFSNVTVDELTENEEANVPIDRCGGGDGDGGRHWLGAPLLTLHSLLPLQRCQNPASAGGHNRGLRRDGGERLQRGGCGHICDPQQRCL